MVQAHLCGRLPRDTLVVCLNPELPPSLLCMDVAYYFRWVGGGLQVSLWPSVTGAGAQAFRAVVGKDA